jgi:vacuolar-type H+-ATPase subunit F/Vma7
VVQLLQVIKEQGPLTGKDFVRETGLDIFEAWQFCASSPYVITSIVGRRYLRLDQKVDDYARLSPSIMREFLNYTVIGLAGQEQALGKLANQIAADIAAISARKIALARDTIARLVENHHAGPEIKAASCFIIAGDVVFGMAHAEPRPESSTGELVRGSDLDIITVTDGLSPALNEELDSIIYREKYALLMNPASKEELDYIIKELQLVEEQLKFDHFKAMVASKILVEGQYLYGSKKIFDRIKELIRLNAVAEKLATLETKAVLDRKNAEKELLGAPKTADREQLMALFFTTEEKEEIF